MLRDVIEADLPVFFEHQRDPIAARMAALVAARRRCRACQRMSPMPMTT